MTLELFTPEERAEAEEHLAEALRILNMSIRHAHDASFDIQTQIVTMHTRYGAIQPTSLIRLH